MQAPSFPYGRSSATCPQESHCCGVSASTTYLTSRLGNSFLLGFLLNVASCRDALTVSVLERIQGSTFSPLNPSMTPPAVVLANAASTRAAARCMGAAMVRNLS